jgi:hypothetical protein
MVDGLQLPDSLLDDDVTVGELWHLAAANIERSHQE